MSGPITKEVSMQTASGNGSGSFKEKKPQTDKLEDGVKRQATILFVDDQILIPRSISRALRGSYETRIFENPHDALQSYKAGGVDMVVSDYNMNCDMNGLSLLKALKSHDEQARVVVLSGGLRLEQRDELLVHGAEYVLPKPVDLPLLRLALSNVIDRKRMVASRLLVVDDNEATSRALADILGPEHLSIATAVNGLDGYAKYSAGGFDLVISDLNMPLMDGHELLRMIIRGNPSAKVIMMSGDVQEEDKRQLYDSGALAVIEKPIDTEILRVAMVAALGRTS